jgi:transposase
MNTQKLVGVDTHKDTIACYCDGKFKEFKTNTNGFKQAIKWAGKAHWAIEGAYCFGRAFTTHLIKNGCEVYEINPLLTKNWRGALKVASSKNDYGDAKVISIFAKTSNLEKISLETVKLKEKLTARKALVKQKTKTTNFIKMMFFTRGEQLPFKKLDTKKSVNFLINNDDVIIRTHGKILIEVIEGIKLIEKEIEKETPEKAKKLMQLKGISFITASTIYTETKGKITTSAKLASYCGVAPIDCSSGKTTRMRNNRGGNRILNSVFYSLSIAQKRYNPISKEYYEKKLSEGKTPRHARKCLARQLINIVFKILKDD